MFRLLAVVVTVSEEEKNPVVSVVEEGAPVTVGGDELTLSVSFSLSVTNEDATAMCNSEVG